MTQIITNSNGGGGGGGASYTAGTGIDITSNVISVDTDVVQTVGNMVDNLTGADNDHYPTAKAVADAISGGGSGDVVGPNSSTDGDIALFDGTTGKIIKDSGVGLSSKLDASALSDTNYGGAWNGDTTHTPTKNALYTKLHTMDVEIGNKAADNTVVKLSGNQTINGTKTFGTSPVVPSKTTTATNDGTAIATEAQVKTVADDVATINGMISSNASSSNKLMDKNYIDDSINSVTAYYITKNAAGDQFATKAELTAATTFYSGGVQRTPTRNDYTIVLDDEDHDNATTRYIYNSGWEYQYTVNETALTQAQLDALNSGITSGKVSTYDGYASTIAGKQDALTSQTAYTSQGTSTKVPSITTNSLGQVTGIVETNIDFPTPPTVNDGTLTIQKNGTDVQTFTANQGSNVTANIQVNEVPSGGNEGDVLTNVSGTPTWKAPTGTDYSWVTKTISGGEIELGIRTIVNIPGSDFTLTAPATLKEGEEYVIRIISEDSYTITLGTGFTNPRGVDLKLTSGATDQFVFVAIGGILELQAEIQA